MITSCACFAFCERSISQPQRKSAHVLTSSWPVRCASLSMTDSTTQSSSGLSYYMHSMSSHSPHLIRFCFEQATVELLSSMQSSHTTHEVAHSIRQHSTNILYSLHLTESRFLLSLVTSAEPQSGYWISKTWVANARKYWENQIADKSKVSNGAYSRPSTPCLTGCVLLCSSRKEKRACEIAETAMVNQQPHTHSQRWLICCFSSASMA